jgi:hypothetical protein
LMTLRPDTSETSEAKARIQGRVDGTTEFLPFPNSLT